MNKYLLSAVGLVLTLWIGTLVFSLGVTRLPDFVQSSLPATVKVQGTQRIKQQFNSQYNNFSSLGISLMNRQLQNKKNLELTIWDGNQKIRTAVINGLYIQDGKFLRFDFEPIPDSANKQYLLDFSSPDSTQEDGLEIFLTKDERPEYGQLLVSEQPYVEYRSVAFVSFHKPDSFLSAFGIIMGDFMRRLMSDMFFLVGMIVLIIGLISFGFSKKVDSFFKRFN